MIENKYRCMPKSSHDLDFGIHTAFDRQEVIRQRVADLSHELLKTVLESGRIKINRALAKLASSENINSSLAFSDAVSLAWDHPSALNAICHRFDYYQEMAIRSGRNPNEAKSQATEVVKSELLNEPKAVFNAYEESLSPMLRLY